MTWATDEADRAGRPPGWWPYAAAAFGLFVAIPVGVNSSEGNGEISGVAAASLFAGVVILRQFRHRRWFWPYWMVQAMAHIALICFFVAPSIHDRSKIYILLIWPDIVVTVGLGFLIAHLTRGARRDEESLDDEGEGA